DRGLVGAGRQVQGLLVRVLETGDGDLAVRPHVHRRGGGDVADHQAALAGVERGDVVGEGGHGGVAVGVQVGGGGVVAARLEADGDRPDHGLGGVGRVGGGDRDLVVAGGELEGSGELGRLEVVERQLAVDVHV